MDCLWPLKLIILTDLHMVPVGETILDIDPAERLSAALAHIALHHADADRVIVTGDLAHYGDEASYVRLRDCLHRLALPVTLMLGNHDRRPAFRRVFSSSAVDRNGFVQTIVDCKSWRLVCLDTLGVDFEDGDDDDHGAGRLCHNRLAWFEAALASAGERPVLLFLHHPPHPVGFRGMDRIRLRDEARFFEIVQKYGNVRHMFSGHVHRTINGSARGIPFSIFKSPVHQQPMTFFSDDTSLSVPEPAAYGIVFAHENSVVVHTEDYQLSRLDQLIA
jgi:3',5'-cyclic AMP phosphodiesterase CpdA